MMVIIIYVKCTCIHYYIITMQIFNTREDILTVALANQIHSSNDSSSCSTIQTEILGMLY